MTIDTQVRATSPIDWRLMFLKARDVVGIPPEHPFERTHWGALSEPGGFGAMVTVHAGHYRDPDEPPYVVLVNFCSSIDEDYRTTTLPEHRRYVAELGEWLDSIGVTWEAETE